MTTMLVDLPSPPFLYGTAWKEDRTATLTELALRAGFRGIDTANQHSTFANECTQGRQANNCDTLASNGQSAQTRTNVLLGVTGGLAVLKFFGFARRLPLPGLRGPCGRPDTLMATTTHRKQQAGGPLTEVWLHGDPL